MKDISHDYNISAIGEGGYWLVNAKSKFVWARAMSGEGFPYIFVLYSFVCAGVDYR